MTGAQMLGWWIGVFRVADSDGQLPTLQSKTGARVAEWQTGAAGTDWLDQLVRDGQGLQSLGGCGYPLRYVVKAGVLGPYLRNGPPGARKVWLREPGDVVTSEWKGKTTIYEDTLSACASDEWLVVEAWDES